MIHQIGFRSEIGQSHQVNQDAGGAWSVVRSDRTVATLLIVADGVSAGRRSEDASRLVVDLLRDRLDSPLRDASQDIEALLQCLSAATQEANHRVAMRPHDSPRNADATTLAALVCVNEVAAGIWCGDSRVYKIGQGVTRLTRDHSWAEGVVSHGLMTAEQATLDPRAHMITRWLGPPDQEDPGIETFRTELGPGEAIVCCSDGLSMYFASPFGEEHEMRTVLEPGCVQDGVDSLIELSLSRGGHDDITVAALKMGDS